MTIGIKIPCVFCDGLGYHLHVSIHLMNYPEPAHKIPCKNCEGKGYYIHFPKNKEV
jgi:hypothetical protein